MFFCLTISYGFGYGDADDHNTHGEVLNQSDLEEATTGTWADLIEEVRSHGVIVTVDYDGGCHYTKYWIPIS
jgi:hypothetical protein